MVGVLFTYEALDVMAWIYVAGILLIGVCFAWAYVAARWRRRRIWRSVHPYR